MHRLAGSLQSVKTVSIRTPHAQGFHMAFSNLSPSVSAQEFGMALNQRQLVSA